MMKPLRHVTLIAAMLLCGQATANDGHWVGSWTASAQPAWEADFAVDLGMPRTFADQTVRQRARLSIGGSRVRIEVSNEYGERLIPERPAGQHMVTLALQ